MHTNKINNKIYIGQTVYGNNPNRRWQNGKGYSSKSYFGKAINKYGWNSFDHEIIANNLTKEEANNFEKLLIKELNTMNPNKGYNLTSGGDGTVGWKPTEKTKQNISKSLKGKNVGNKNPMFGISPQKRMSQEQYIIWVKHDKEAQLKVDRKSGKNPMAKKCIRLSDLKIFNSLKDAADDLHVSKSTMCFKCKNKTDYMYYSEYLAEVI